VILFLLSLAPLITGGRYRRGVMFQKLSRSNTDIS
jgi:hypothetical protein